MDCLFCKIIAGEIPATKMYEDENMLIFKDIDPKAKNHYLCVPKSHFKLLADMTDEQAEMLSYLHKRLFKLLADFSDDQAELHKACFKKIPQLQKELGLENGYRLVINQGDDAGQTVFHLHIHILSGQKMGWTPA